MTPDEQSAAARRSRNNAMGIVLGGLAILFFAITLVKLATA